MTQSLGIDIGGTFTDAVVFDHDTGRLTVAKTPTVRHEPARGVLAAVARTEVDLSTVATFVHGTTLGLNTLLERRGATTGLLTTAGFRDAIEIGRMAWPMYHVHWPQPAPLIPRFLRQEVRERMSADGRVLVAIDEQDVRRALDLLVAEGAVSVAVCFLHSYLSTMHEERVGEIIAAEYPGLDFALSSRITREYREFERSVTTAVEAMIKGTLVQYLDALDGALREAGFGGRFLMSRCDGGAMGIAEMRDRSLNTLISGPAGGVVGAARLGRELSIDRIIAADMGGTSFEACVVSDYEPLLTGVTRVADMPLLLSSIEIASIGAGGGSIAWIDTGGALCLGPESAGADPGPICYGRGGGRVTFTDAAIVSGLLDSQRFLGGELELDAAAARAGVETLIGAPLGMSADEAASGIVALAEAMMASAIEEITIGKGYDPRDFTLIAYGGGGPLVASALAARLDLARVVVPLSPATFSAWGMLSLDVVHDVGRTHVRRLDDMTVADIAAILAELDAQAGTALDREGVPPERQRLRRGLEMRYRDQEHTLSIAVDPAGRLALDALRDAFHEKHRSTYGYVLDEPVEVVTYRVRAVGETPSASRYRAAKPRLDATALPRAVRPILHRQSGGAVDAAVFDRELLAPGAAVAGPAIIEEASATTLVGPTQTVTVDPFGNLVMTSSEAGA